MGLSYNEMYNITGGLYLAFSNKKNNKRILTVNHGQAKRDKMEMIFPANQYSTWTRENFIIANLYIQYKRAPSSLIGTIEILKDLEEKDVYKFKDEIVYYRKHLKNDIERIKVEQGANPGLDYMIQEYRNNSIKWYTFYFYLMVSNADMETLKKSRLNGYLIQKINKLLLYVTFSEKSMLLVREIMKDTIEI